MNIQEIKVTKFPLVIITDTHCSISKITRVRQLHKDCDIISLGDITDLFKGPGDLNSRSIDYFINTKIPCLEGNHESFIKACYSNNYDVMSHVIINPRSGNYRYDIDEAKHIPFLKSLPRGFKLILPDGRNYLCFHNRPDDLWSITEENQLMDSEFECLYPCDDKTIGVLVGHNHKVFTKIYHNGKKRFGIGALKYDDYALLTENGIEAKRL
jgi:predicted phosphodiesterase